MAATGTHNPRARSRAVAGYSGFRATLKLVATGPRGSRELMPEEARDAVAALLTGEATEAQAGAFLVAARVKGESAGELAGYAQALRDASIGLRADARERPLVACAGAYDGARDVPQLSLAAGALAASCGAGVVIHCGPRIGPKYGVTPADVLAALGGPAPPSLAESEAMLARAGVTVVDTSLAVRGYRTLLGVRDEVGVRGPVHSAEKLIDYFGAERFVVGYTHSPYAGRLLGALALLGARRAVAVRGIEGSDVVRPGRPVAHELRGAIELPERAELPERVGSPERVERTEAMLRTPGGAESSAELTRAILTGVACGAERTAVLYSAAIRLYAAGVVRDARHGVELAVAAISDGRAEVTLAALTGR